MSNMKEGGRRNEAHEQEKGGNEDKGQKEADKWKSQLDTDTDGELWHNKNAWTVKAEQKWKLMAVLNGQRTAQQGNKMEVKGA